MFRQTKSHSSLRLIGLVLLLFLSLLIDAKHVEKKQRKKAASKKLDCWTVAHGVCRECKASECKGDDKEKQSRCFATQRDCCLGSNADISKCNLETIVKEDCEDGFAVSRNDSTTNRECAALCAIATYSGNWTKFREYCVVERVKTVKHRKFPIGPCFNSWIYGHSDTFFNGADNGTAKGVGVLKSGVTTPAECQDVCQASSDCVNFLWRSADSKNASKGNCLLKTFEIVDRAMMTSLDKAYENEKAEWCPLSDVRSFCGEAEGRCKVCHDNVCVYRSEDHVSGPRVCGSRQADKCPVFELMVPRLDFSQVFHRGRDGKPIRDKFAVTTAMSHKPKEAEKDRCGTFLENGNFEQPALGLYEHHRALRGNEIPGWWSEQDEVLGIVKTGFSNIRCAGGFQCLRLLSGKVRLHTKVHVSEPGEYSWSLNHRNDFRGGKVYFEIMEENDLVLQKHVISDSSSEWSLYNGTIAIDRPRTLTLRFRPLNSWTAGGIVDAVYFGRCFRAPIMIVYPDVPTPTVILPDPPVPWNWSTPSPNSDLGFLRTKIARNKGKAMMNVDIATTRAIKGKGRATPATSKATTKPKPHAKSKVTKKKTVKAEELDDSDEE